MGWDYGYGDKRRDVIRKIKRGWKSEDGSGNEILSATAKGNVLWTLNKATRIDGTTEIWIGCHLLGASDGDWGKKDMCESMGPCYWSCPEEYLRQAPMPDSPYAQKWRDEVEKYHEQRRKRAVKKGDKAILVHTAIEHLNGMTVTIEGRRRSKLMARAADGTLLLVPPQCVERVAA